MVLLHEKGIAHNDIRSCNILLTKDSRGYYHLILADFGECRFLSESESEPEKQTKDDVRWVGTCIRDFLSKNFSFEFFEQFIQICESPNISSPLLFQKYQDAWSTYPENSIEHLLFWMSHPDIKQRPTIQQAFEKFQKVDWSGKKVFRSGLED